MYLLAADAESAYWPPVRARRRAAAPSDDEAGRSVRSAGGLRNLVRRSGSGERAAQTCGRRRRRRRWRRGGERRRGPRPVRRRARHRRGLQAPAEQRSTQPRRRTARRCPSGARDIGAGSIGAAAGLARGSAKTRTRRTARSADRCTAQGARLAASRRALTPTRRTGASGPAAPDRRRDDQPPSGARRHRERGRQPWRPPRPPARHACGEHVRRRARRSAERRDSRHVRRRRRIAAVRAPVGATRSPTASSAPRRRAGRGEGVDERDDLPLRAAPGGRLPARAAHPAAGRVHPRRRGRARRAAARRPRRARARARAASRSPRACCGPGARPHARAVGAADRALPARAATARRALSRPARAARPPRHAPDGRLDPQRPREPWSLPAELAELEFLEVELVATSTPLRGRQGRRARTFTARCACRGARSRCWARQEREQRLAEYGAVLAALARDDSPVRRIAWIERTLPGDADALGDYLLEAKRADATPGGPAGGARLLPAADRPRRRRRRGTRAAVRAPDRRAAPGGAARDHADGRRGPRCARGARRRGRAADRAARRGRDHRHRRAHPARAWRRDPRRL